ncbi:efflux RND transporter periplasmic adaptor subunit [Marinobacter halodurans]|uniref:Efflux RND transporter periplasmic adaptor subunit n=1 Tax=Marinobacter halodurans TaxID=2528979 RepID=A0ABY1ZML5_9GAMM|nr:efflux RND transporter periplasmic adaptor subunit [Marinobacter halodurans]TBW57637.1 efflux RND transporter periplasmic adaptor subunit [Marinobacter halodurans]
MAKTASRTPLLTPGRVSVLTLGLLTALLIAVYQSAPEQKRAAPAVKSPEFEVLEVQPRTLALTLASQGIAEPRRRLRLAFRTEGEIVEVSPAFENGGWVEKGQDLARQETLPLELMLSQRKHDLSSARLHMEQARARARMARRDVAPNATAFARHEPQLEEAQARVEAARLAVKRVAADLARATLKAPFSGRLEQVNISVGETVAAGEVLGELYSAGDMEVRLPLRDRWLVLLDGDGEVPGSGKEPLSIPVTLEGRFAGRVRSWQGVITRREGGVSRNQMSWLIAEVHPDAHRVPLEPGVFVEAGIHGRRFDDMVVLPRSAMIPGEGVWVVDESGRLQRRRVSVVYKEGDRVFITGGLAAGERVLLRGTDLLSEGMKVRTRLQDPSGGVAMSTAGSRR